MTKALALLFALLVFSHAAAQETTETPTPEPTPEVTVEVTPESTPEVTPTVTPDIYVFWTLVPVSTDTPGQAVALKYEMTAGGIVNTMLIFAIFVTLLVMLTIVMLRKTRK